MPLTWTRDARVGKPTHWPVSVEPASEPVSADQMRVPAREASTNYEDEAWDGDWYYSSILIPGARAAIEADQSASFITQTRKAYYDALDMTGRLWLPGGPVQSITSIVVTNDAGSTETAAAASYTLIGADNPDSYVVLNDGYAWPSDPRCHEAMCITYVCGYGATAIGTPDYNGTAANGSGDNELATGGAFCDTIDSTYTVTILTSTTFEYSRDGVRKYRRERTITGRYQLLDSGVYVKLPATSGYTPGDYWDISCTGHSVPRRYVNATLMLARHIDEAAAGAKMERGAVWMEPQDFPAKVRMLLGRRVRV